MKTKKARITRAFDYWRRHPESNWGIGVLQTPALPLGYVADGAENGTRTRDPHLGKVVLYH